MKRCSLCAQVKPLDAFSPAPANRDGLTLNCKVCRAAWARAYRTAHPERKAESNRRQRERQKRMYTAHNQYTLQSVEDRRHAAELLALVLAVVSESQARFLRALLACNADLSEAAHALRMDRAEARKILKDIRRRACG